MQHRSSGSFLANISKNVGSFETTILWVAIFCVSQIGCINPSILFKKDGPRKNGLVTGGGFEAQGDWRISAPPNYANHAEISITNSYAKSGRKSAYVRIERHPGAGGSEILHAWTQEIGETAAGARVRFGGWVRTNGEPKVKVGLNIRFATAVNGRTFANVYLDQPTGAEGNFVYMERIIQLPEIPSSISIRAGISTIGEAWFDDLFVKVER